MFIIIVFWLFFSLGCRKVQQLIHQVIQVIERSSQSFDFLIRSHTPYYLPIIFNEYFLNKRIIFSINEVYSESLPTGSIYLLHSGLRGDLPDRWALGNCPECTSVILILSSSDYPLKFSGGRQSKEHRSHAANMARQITRICIFKRTFHSFYLSHTVEHPDSTIIPL